jgi:nicotinamide mononucleotide transporter
MGELETIAVVLALAYLLLAMRQNRLCWVAAFLSALIYLVIFADVKLYMEAGLQVIYAVMAIVGWVFWGQDDSEDTLAVTTRPASFHLLTLAAIGICTLVSGAVLTTYTDAARPFIDAGTTVSAILCTWMVTRKILENWLYWIVINAVSVWLFMDRGLSLTSGLFALYIVLSVIGYLSWRRTMAHP